ncbi:hypothetical protein CUR178_05816 [Leishmania enriettii]|uniref:Uncharacterized protein n=1 Tax=Leishmania enriettii TaxID=5663 RepID=A0A836KNA5_LEIEN|nr:hypothetical protein CUR178_05816 [Leishmania enriettii]
MGMTSNMEIKSALQPTRGCKAPLSRRDIDDEPGVALASASGSCIGAAHHAVASVCAPSALPLTTGNGLATDAPAVIPGADRKNWCSRVLQRLPHPQAALATQNDSRCGGPHRRIALSMESVLSWEDDTAVTSASEAECRCHTSTRSNPVHASTTPHMCHERAAEEPAAHYTGRRDGAEDDSISVSSFSRLDERLTRARRRNRARALSSCSNTAALSQESAGVSAGNRRRVRPRQLRSQLVEELLASDSVIDLLNEDWPC